MRTDKGRRWVEMELDLPGTPEQVWRAMATSQGMTAWFVPVTVEERVGGAMTFQFGDGIESKGEVRVWEPPYRFVYEEAGWSGEAPPLATEILIEAKSGGVCRMTMAHSLFTEKDDWDKEIEGMEKGWPPFFDVLRIYLQHFPDLPAATARPTTRFDGEMKDAWIAATRAMKLNDAKVGERRDVKAGDAAPLSGIVERRGEDATHNEITLRLSKPMSGVALIGAYHWGGNTRIAVSLYFYGADAEQLAKREEPLWSAWLKQEFAPAEKDE